MKTFSAKAAEVERKWWLIDAKDQILGKVAVNAANVLRGKNKPIFTSHVDTGDYVVVINAEHVVLSGKKETDKVYSSHSGFIGGQKQTNPERVRQKHPELLLEKAIKGMIPHNSLGSDVYRKLKVYKGSAHPHEAQAPQPLALI